MDERKKFNSREELSRDDTWATEDLFASEELWWEELEELKAQKEVFLQFAGKLGRDGKSLFEYLSRMEQVNSKAHLLANYAMCKSDEDTRDTKYLAMMGGFQTAAVELDAATSFAVPEIMAISDEILERFYGDCPELERYRRYLSNLRRRKDHTLSSQEERLLAAAGEMAEAPGNIYSNFINADMKFPNAVDAQGKNHPLNQATFVPMQESADRVLRQSAYENLYDTLAGFKNSAAAMLNMQNKQLKFYSDARKYDNARQAALDGTNVPVEVYDNLIEAVHKNLDKMHRYVRLRKKMLGVEELHFYDVYTPLLSDVDKHIPFEEAKQTVYDALYPLGDEYRAVLKEGLENRWIDVYPTPGKRSGAYASGAQVHPYVLLNYTGTLMDQFTLAHEMGHALHSYLSNKVQNPIDSHYVIFVAEVASTCNEALLMEYLLNKTQDKRERAYLINHFLEQFKGTLYRQTMFAEFERNIGRMTAEGKTLTADVLSAEYKRLNEEYFGPDMVVDDRIAMEWARIPHFYYNYYVFQYATGYAAAIALSRKILTEGEPAVKDYLGFLSGGCSKSPIELLRGAGVDMMDPESVEKALELFGSLLDEMEALVEE